MKQENFNKKQENFNKNVEIGFQAYMKSNTEHERLLKLAKIWGNKKSIVNGIELVDVCIEARGDCFRTRATTENYKNYIKNLKKGIITNLVEFHF